VIDANKKATPAKSVARAILALLPRVMLSAPYKILIVVKSMDTSSIVGSYQRGIWGSKRGDTRIWVSRLMFRWYAAEPAPRKTSME